MRLSFARAWMSGFMGFMGFMGFIGLVGLFGLAGSAGMVAAAGAQSPANSTSSAEAATVQIEYTNPGLTPSHWVLRMHSDGSGQFDSDGAAPGSPGMRQIEAGDVHRSVQLSQNFAGQVFATARDRKLFAFPCDGHMKVAFQGTKRLSYSGPEGSGACEFNYSKDQQIEALANSLLGVEFTILSGARMEMLLQHDRLGLDAELDGLMTAIQSGNAQELGTIRETLTRIATHEQVLERARRKAHHLLTQVR